MKTEINKMNVMQLAQYFANVKLERENIRKAQKDLSSLDSFLNNVADMTDARKSLKDAYQALEKRQDVLREEETSFHMELMRRKEIECM